MTEAPPELQVNVLLIEDSKGDAILFEKELMRAAPDGCRVRKAENLAQGLKALSDSAFDVVLLDLSLPDTIQFSGLLGIQNMAPNLPVIMLTAHADEQLALEAVRYGAQDYLFKDKADGRAIKRAIQYAIQRKQFEASLITRANFDPLTGLANRSLFESRLDLALARAQRTEAGVAIFFLDLDKFKQVNDTLGHLAGDALLSQVAERLNQSIREYDTAARFGGDEFALLIEGVNHTKDCEIIAEKITRKIAEPFMLEGTRVEIGVSIGITTSLEQERLARDALVAQADQAMYEAKQVSGNIHRFYIPEKSRNPAAAQ